MDRLIRLLSTDGRLRVLALSATAAAQEVARRHGLEGATAQRLAAEGTVSALLLSAHIKGDERILLELANDAPRFVFSGEARADGTVRARLKPARIGPLHHLSGKFATVKWNDRIELYRGTAAMDHADLQAVLRGYLRDSQQTLGRAWLHATLDDQGIAFAGGLLVERLPVRDGLDSQYFDRVMDTFEADDPVARIQAAQLGIMPGLELVEVDAQDVRFACTCSLARVEASVCTLGAADVRALQAEQGQAEVTCDFCAERYVVPGPRLMALAESLEAQGPGTAGR